MFTIQPNNLYMKLHESLIITLYFFFFINETPTLQLVIVSSGLPKPDLRVVRDC